MITLRQLHHTVGQQMITLRQLHHTVGQQMITLRQLHHTVGQMFIARQEFHLTVGQQLTTQLLLLHHTASQQVLIQADIQFKPNTQRLLVKLQEIHRPANNLGSQRELSSSTAIQGRSARKPVLIL